VKKLISLGYGNYHLITVIAVDGDQMVINHGRQTTLTRTP